QAGAPPLLALARPEPPRVEPSGDLTDRHAVPGEPLEDLPDDLRLRGIDLEPRHAVPVLLADVTIPVPGAAEDSHGARAGPAPLPAPAPLEDLGPFVFGDDALDLQEQLALGRRVNGVVEEDDLGAGPLEFLDQEHLIGVLAGEPVGREDVDTVDGARGDLVAEAL